ncbi:hypothetical protein MGH68_11000 [Erysipelothrix sp. D19-032]
MKKTVILGVVVAFAIILGGCSAKKQETVVLNLGMMPAVDAAPILYAQENGIFDGLNLEVNVDIYRMPWNVKVRFKATKLMAR